jgi:RNA polymerase sigma-70 factor (ECF subfamily)
MPRPINDARARDLRRAWFDYLDMAEALRAPLHAYGMRLTGNVWDAEDLVQETLLRGFAMIGRGDLHGLGSPVTDVRAYLFRIATHLHIDDRRRKARRDTIPPSVAPSALPPESVREAGEQLLRLSPQARAAILLTDVYGFSLADTADFLRTSVGAVKSALHRGRDGLRSPDPEPRDGPSRALIDAFVDAYNAQDLDRLLAVVTETVSIEVPGVGGGRGLRADNGWADWAISQPVRAVAEELDGEHVVAILLEMPEGPRLCEVLRLDGDAEADPPRVSRIVDYCYAADTLAYAAAAFGFPPVAMGYRQDLETLAGMIATTTRPWGSPGLAAGAPSS